jgi:ElaB/YqjD/DUF883 family membrane-anchored ribosome-binding protein
MQTDYQTNTSSTEDTDVRQKVEETASTVVDQAAQVASTQVKTQKERAASTLDAVAKTLYETGTGMREQQPQLASLADQAASRVVDASAYLREHEVSDLVREAESFAKREPVLFMGAAFAIGFMAARFIKASAPQSGQGGSQGQGFQGQGQRNGGRSQGNGGSSDWRGLDAGASIGNGGGLSGSYDESVSDTSRI